jgi:hypothetical protein
MTMAAVAETTAEGAVVVVVMTVVAVVVERILVGATIVAGTGLTIVAAAEDAEAMTMLDHERRIVDGAGVAQMIPWPRARLGTGHENSIRRAHARGGADHLIEVRRVRGRGADDTDALDDNGGRTDRDRRFEPGDDRRVNGR